MSHRKIPHFDVIEGEGGPYTGFGSVLPFTTDREREFGKSGEVAARQIETGFEKDLSEPSMNARKLDEIITEMWEECWDPHVGDVNRFVTDLGLVLTKTLGQLIGGKLIFRSETDLTHTSLYWAEVGMEAFPFHKIYKCLVEREGESVSAYVLGLQQLMVT